MNKAIFYVMGAIVFSFVAGLVLVGVLAAGHFSLHIPPMTPAMGIRFGVMGVGLVLVGVGLFRLRKWAALAFSLMTLYPAFWAFKDAIHSVPWSWDGIGYWFGLLLIAPAAFTVIFWRTLVWRNRVK